MSRTHKDVKRRYRSPENEPNYGTVLVPVCYVTTHYRTGEDIVINTHRTFPVAGAKTKKSRNKDTTWPWWSQTPSWWIHQYMNRPQRSRGNAWARAAGKMSLEELEDTLPPDVSRKPHIYYW